MEEILITRLFPEEISEQLGLEPFRGRQIFRWIHEKHVLDIQKMTDLSKNLRNELEKKSGILSNGDCSYSREFRIGHKKGPLSFKRQPDHRIRNNSPSASCNFLPFYTGRLSTQMCFLCYRQSRI